jgi:hypothetical protein
MAKETTMDVKLVPVDQVELDLGNPRIARVLEMFDPKQVTSEQIALALGAGDSQEGETYTTFYSLKESIRTHGGIIQPIIVNRLPDGRLVVIEGNTRLQVYREFVRDKVPGKWDKIPAAIYDNLDAKSIDAIRLQAHLVGPRPWDPYSKARYLNRLRNSDHMTFEQIVDFCGGRRRQVAEYIQAFNDMEAYYRPALPSSDSFDPTRFSSFVELQRPNVQGAVAAAGFTKADFAKWVIEDLIGPQQNVRQLPRILDHPKARATFLEDGAQEALKALEVPPADASLAEATLAQLAQELQRRLARLEWRDFQRMKSDPRRCCWDRLAA